MGEDWVVSTEDDAGHRGRSALVASAATAALVVGVAAVVVFGPSLLDCSPPSQKALQAQEAFVLRHIPEARDVESGTADCDDNGDGYVYFTTDLTPEAARDAFLADRSCSPYTEDDVDEIAVKCRSRKKMVYLFFSATDEGTTDGALNLS